MGNPDSAKHRRKVRSTLGQFGRATRATCWVCGSVHGVKAGRAAYGVRCRRCIERGKHTAETRQYEQFLEALE